MSLKEAIQNKDIKQVREIAKNIPSANIADEIEKLTPKEGAIFLRMLPMQEQSEVFGALEFEHQEKLIHSLDDKAMKQIISEVFTSDIADLIDEVPSNVAKRILKNLDKDKRKLVNRILNYKEEEVGSIMHVDIITLSKELTIKQATAYIEKNKKATKLSHYFYVIDSDEKLVGNIALEDLLFGKATIKLSEIVKPVQFVTTRSDKEEASLIFAEHDRSTLPVINTKEKVVGMITAEDIIDVLQEEATEDMEKMAGIESSDDTPYSKRSVFSIFRSRVF